MSRYAAIHRQGCEAPHRSRCSGGIPVTRSGRPLMTRASAEAGSAGASCVSPAGPPPPPAGVLSDGLGHPRVEDSGDERRVELADADDAGDGRSGPPNRLLGMSRAPASSRPGKPRTSLIGLGSRCARSQQPRRGAAAMRLTRAPSWRPRRRSRGQSSGRCLNGEHVARADSDEHVRSHEPLLQAAGEPVRTGLFGDPPVGLARPAPPMDGFVPGRR